MNKIYCAVYELVKAHFEGNEDDFKRNLKNDGKNMSAGAG